MKKTILHIIENLGRGGAETMLVEVLKKLQEYNNVVVTFTDVNHFKEKIACTKHYNLEVTSIIYLPFAISKLKKIIKETNADAVHSHLYWPTLLARFSVPKKIPLLTTIHNFIASVPHYKKGYMRFLDSASYKLRPSVIIGVAEGARKEYFDFLKLTPHQSYCLYTFVNPELFNLQFTKADNSSSTFKLVTLASLSYQKNHIFLINAFEQLKNENIELHIYGSGKLQKELEMAISKTGSKVKLMGQINNASQTLPHYDLYVMASYFEGFSLSVLEAMAMQLPLLLTNIPSFKEQCAADAQYYELNNTADFIEKLKNIYNNENLRKSIAAAGKQRVLNNFTLEHHMDGLRKIYSAVIKND